MRLSGILLCILSIGLALPLGACVPGENEGIPGESIGSHLFSGSLAENSCGPEAVPALDLIELRVQLRENGGMGIWRRPGAPIIYGAITAEGDWRITNRSTIGVYDYDPLTGRGPCALDQVETIQFSLVDLEEPEEGEEQDTTERYAGSSTVEFFPSAGSDCGASLVVLGGPFYDLPCQIEYSLSSEPIDPLFAAEESSSENTP